MKKIKVFSQNISQKIKKTKIFKNQNSKLKQNSNYFKNQESKFKIKIQNKRLSHLIFFPTLSNGKLIVDKNPTKDPTVNKT